MKVLILNGSLKHQSHLMPFQQILEQECINSQWDHESILLHETRIGTCIGCFNCWDTTPGLCFQDDQGGEVAKKAINSDLLVFLTPLTWGGYSSELKKAIERMLGLLHPGFTKIEGSNHHKKRYKKYPSVLGIGIVEEEIDEVDELIFKTLIKCHSLNWHTPKQKAVVLRVGQDKQQIRNRLQTLISEMEVKQ